ncbi:MAG TPA: hypothetical protein PLP82_12975 [Deltaproteobacteria bacterium]|nr:hypothetical protein [Deltaproteobacteria bacterium]HPR04818.1 hypothetical protein [Deltaproteobacteria bacterium]
MRIRKITLSALFFMLSLFITWFTIEAATGQVAGTKCVKVERAISSDHQRTFRETP